ncbi:hypothetical protein ACTPOK_42550 [Streptomyces inhibens]|uniref:hypothetical protein n=1 Tax=Streptomyces inhibens TaxID=2293571 RepID=UPI00402A9420
MLIHSPAGGLGLAAIGIAQGAVATALATAGNANKPAYLRDLGIEHVFDSRDLGLMTRRTDRFRELLIADDFGCQVADVSWSSPISEASRRLARRLSPEGIWVN